MFHNLSTWALMLSAVSSQFHLLSTSLTKQSHKALTCSAGILASPLSSSIYEQNAEAELVERQIACPVGQDCGPGPVCAGQFCELDTCADAPACQDQSKKRSEAAPLVARGFGCPPDIPCGSGPVCAGSFCDLPACEGSSLCVNETEKRSQSAPLADRGLGCPPGVPCGAGPVCAGSLCEDPACIGSSLCVDETEK